MVWHKQCYAASLFHSLISVERYLAMKHPLKYKHDLVTEAHIIMASGLAWICALVILNTNKDFGAVISSEVFIHVVMYKEVRWNARQIIANQVSLAVKENLLKNRKAFNSTVVILLTLYLLCSNMSLNDYFYFFEWKNPVWSWTNHFLSFWISGGAKFVDKPTHLYSKNQTIPCNFHSGRLTRTIFEQAEELENKIFESNHLRVA